ncbi:hypothetical protein YW7DRAFT_01319 [Streptomyces sp. AmelKG-E11A]|nr:hypothetical protein YW7DRAFT_01319 [Streptomyces sp. AmelKG-E11A]
MRVGVTVPAVPMTTVTVPPVPGSRPAVPGSAVLRCAVLREAVPGTGLAAARAPVPGGPLVARSVSAGSGVRRMPVFRGVRG